MDETAEQRLARTDRVQALSRIAFWLDYPQYKVNPDVSLGIVEWMVLELGEATCKDVLANNHGRITSLLFYLIELDPAANFNRVMTTLRLLGFGEATGFENDGYPR